MTVSSRFELFVNDEDISPQIKAANAHCSTADWFIHATCEDEEPTSGILSKLDGRSVAVKFRFTMTRGDEEATSSPWRQGQGVSSWRLNEELDGELIVYGTGRLREDESEDAMPAYDSQETVPVTVTAYESVGGVITNERSSDGEITRFYGPSAEAERVAINEELEIVRAAQVGLVTDPAFVLSLATGAAASNRLLYNSGLGVRDGSLLYSSLVLLPLAVEYFLKYLLIQEYGPLSKEHKNHMLLKLFDALPFSLQKSVCENFEDELRRTGRAGDSHNIRVCLMRFRNAFTTMRYLFDPENANTSLHLQDPDHTIVLVCAMNALERVCGGPLRNYEVQTFGTTRADAEVHGDGHDPMYGVPNSMRKATEAMEELAQFLPDDFMWPTGIHAAPGRVTVEWSQAPLRSSGRTTFGNSVQMDATPVGVTMRAFFRQKHPYVMTVDEDFRPAAMAELLRMLTRDWSWSVAEDGVAIWRCPATVPLPPDDEPSSVSEKHH